tara:strand:- start:1399 stop:2379 length:981 start_codon:yes stop_codon:yes gene_type:complete
LDFTKLRVGVIGTGSVGRRHARNLLALGVREVVLCSEFQGGGDYLEELKTLPIVHDYKELLKTKLDAVVISNSSYLHVKYALLALNHNINIYLEKPAGINSTELKELIELSNTKNAVIALGYQLRFNKLLQTVKSLYEKQVFGQIIYVNCNMGEYLPFYHPKEDYRKGYAAIEKKGGGVLRTQIHDINYLRWILGELQLIAAHGGKVSSLEIDVEDSITALFKTKNNIPVTLHMDYLQKNAHRVLEIYGSDGGLLWNYHKNEIIRWKSSGKTEIINSGQLDRNQLFLSCMEDFISCINDKNKPKSNLLDSYEDLLIVDNIKKVMHI